VAKENIASHGESDQGARTTPFYGTSSSTTGVGLILGFTTVKQPPAELRKREQWVSWKYEKNPKDAEHLRKLPVAVDEDGRYHAISVTNPANYLSWQDARAQTERYMLDGVGFVFTPDDPYFGVDLDSCRDPDTGRVESWAVKIIRSFKGLCYVEVSPSGTGLKLWGRGKKPPGPNKWYPFPGDTDRAIEVYDTARYFAFTGQALDGYTAIGGSAQDALNALCDCAPPPEGTKRTSGTLSAPIGKPRNTKLSDDKILARIKKANPTRYNILFETGTKGDSELDSELACLCAEQVGNDPERIRELMYKSAIVREEKWERSGDNYLPPTIDKAIQHVAAAGGSATDDEQLHALNQTHALVRIGKDSFILETPPDGQSYALMTEHSFRLAFPGQLIDVWNTKKDEPKRMPLPIAWLQWEHRRSYRQLVFKPGSVELPADTYNIWRGWGVTPSPTGLCARFFAHLLHVVCKGNEQHYKWLLDWMADIVQYPQRKLGYAVALKGEMGTGKSLVGMALKPILGRHHIIADKSRQITGNFNAHLEPILLLQAEEAFWAGNHDAEGTLKNLVTGQYLPIERKGIDTVESPNFARVLVTSNADWVWPVEVGDRRLVAFELSDRYADAPAGTPRAARRLTYFARLYEELQHSTFAPHLLHLLLTRALDDAFLRQPPRTRALEEQAIHSMSPPEAWLRNLLLRGELPTGCVVDADGYAHVRVRRLYDSYVGSLAARQHRMTEEAFSLFVKKRLPATTADVEWEGEPRTIFSEREGRHGGHVQARARVILDPLAVYRTQYSRRGRAAPQTWPKPTRWSVRQG
jgi:hypothetical protein